MRTTFIVNPAAGNGRSARSWKKLASSAKQLFGDDALTVFTEKPGQATALCRNALTSGVERIIAVGGDGTLNEVLNGFFDGEDAIETDTALGVLPLGSGCDFARSISLSRSPAKALQELAEATPQPADVGLVRFRTRDGQRSQRLFINIADFGLGGAVVERLQHKKSRLGPTYAYAAAIFQTLASYQNPTIELQLDGQAAQTITLNSVIAANGQFFGAGLRIAPAARIDDGQFDIVLLKDLGLLDVALNLARARKGNHLGHPQVELLRASRLQASSSADVAVDIDGEFAGFLPIEITMLPGAIRILSR